MGNLKDFYLAGHSYGGYIVGNYACKYHRHLKKILLLSPIGINTNVKTNESNFRKKMRRRGRRKPSRIIRHLLKRMFESRISVFQIMRRFGKPFTKFWIKNHAANHIRLEKDEMKLVIDFWYQIFKRFDPTEYALLVNFDQNMQAKLPLGSPKKLGRKNFPIPISIIFGDDDWALIYDQGASEALISKNQFNADTGVKPPRGTWSRYYILPDSDHNMHYDNYIGLTSLIINDLIPEANHPILPTFLY